MTEKEVLDFTNKHRIFVHSLPSILAPEELQLMTNVLNTWSIGAVQKGGMRLMLSLFADEMIARGQAMKAELWP